MCTFLWAENAPESEPENDPESEPEIGTAIKNCFLSTIIVQGNFKHLGKIYRAQMIFRDFRAHTPRKETLHVDVHKLENTFLGSQKLQKIDETNFFHKNYCIMYS